MKTLILLISFLSFGIANAKPEACQASQKTVQTIEAIRTVELPYNIVQAQTVAALREDTCIRNTLTGSEVTALSQMILSFENAQDSVEQIIGEFLAL